MNYINLTWTIATLNKIQNSLKSRHLIAGVLNLQQKPTSLVYYL
jgi:hypothetical protein